jgi:hypothetical protein
MIEPTGSTHERSFSPPGDLDGLQSKAWIVGGAGAVVSVAGWFLESTQFYRSYLVSWVFWLSIAAGCFGILLLQHLARGAWGLMIRRVLGAASRTLPFLGILFIPVVLGLSDIYVWAGPEAAGDELIQQKALYLNPTGFVFRTVVYIAVWSLIAYALSRLSLRQDRTGDPALARRMQMIAAPGLGIFCLLTTFAAVDWLMSLDPHWYSSLFGVYFLGGQAIAALAFVIPVALYLSRREPMSGAFKAVHFHDYGKLLLAFVMLWTYFALSQLLIIWSADLPEEITWYLERAQGGWKWISILLVLFHFLLPFLLLLSRDLKRNAQTLTRVAVLLLVMRWFDIYWLAAPSWQHGHLSFHWLDLATLVGVGGIWFGLFIGQLKTRPLVPVNDPYLVEILGDE